MTPLHTAARMALDALDNLGSMSDRDVTPYAWHGAKAGQACTALREALAAPTPEPVAWQFRWTNPGNNPSVDPSEIEWKTVAPKHPMTSIEDTLANLRAYRFDGKPCYEVRALYAAPPAAPAPVVPADQWKQAIDDELICCHIGTTESFPDAKAALKNLIDWHVSVALDPAVSSDAQALIDKGKSAAPVVPLTDEQIRRIGMSMPVEHKFHSRAFARAIERAHGIGGGGK